MRMHFLKRLLISFLLFFLFNGFSVDALEKNTMGGDIQGRVDQYLQQLAEEKRFSGTVLIAKKGEILFQKGYGMANYELNVENTTDTKFQVGSITKQFTALAIMQLAEKGELDVQDPISKYFPDYPNGEKITIHHLLTHRSGIWDYMHDIDFLSNAKRTWSPQEIVSLFQGKPFSFPPGQKNEYSNSNYVLLGLIIEKLSGMSYEEYISKNILQPSNMHDSGYGDNKKILQNRASGYIMNMEQIENAPFMDPSYVYAAGAMYATAQDLYRWDQMLYTEELLSKIYLDRMFVPDQGGYGYGWKIREWNGYQHIYHDGEYSGFSSQISRFPEQQTVIITLSNFYHAPVSEINTNLAEILLGKEPQKKEKREAKIAPQLYQEYIGKYRFSIGVLEIMEKDGKLYAKIGRENLSLRLLPQDEKTFLVEGTGAKLVFVKEPSGKTSEVIGYLNGKKLMGKKIL